MQKMATYDHRKLIGKMYRRHYFFLKSVAHSSVVGSIMRFYIIICEQKRNRKAMVGRPQLLSQKS